MSRPTARDSEQTDIDRKRDRGRFEGVAGDGVVTEVFPLGDLGLPIPNMWRATTFGTICDANGGGVQTGPFGSQLHKHDYSEEGTPVVMPQDLVNGTISTKSVARVDNSHVDRLSKHQLVEGDILYSRRGDVTRFAVITPREIGWLCGTGCMRIRTDCSDLCPSYLRHFLNHISVKDWLVRNATGATMPNLNTKILRALPVAFPKLSEQKRIAGILDKADAIRRKRQQAIGLTEQFLRSTFLDMFGDPVTNPKKWDKVKLQSLCSIRRGGSPRPIKDYVGGTIPWIKIGDATKGDDIYISKTKVHIKESGLSKTVQLEPGALVFANCGVSLGFARILRISGCIHDGWLSFSQIDASRLNKLFLLKSLNQITDYFQAIAPEGTQPNLTTGIMKSYELPLPPIELQQKFESIVESHIDRNLRVVASADAINSLFNSLVQRAFRGEL